MAVPTLPLTMTVVPKFSISEGLPSGPTMSRILSPACSMLSSMVVLPMAWTTMVTVPASGLASAIVNGIRSPQSSRRTITNCPGFCLRAMRGALITNSLIPRAKGRASTMSYTVPSALILRGHVHPVCGARHRAGGHSAQGRAKRSGRPSRVEAASAAKRNGTLLRCGFRIGAFLLVVPEYFLRGVADVLTGVFGTLTDILGTGFRTLAHVFGASRGRMAGGFRPL